MSKPQTLRREMARVCRRLHELRFVPGTSGNVSARLDSDSILITPSGRSLGELRLDDFVQVRLGGTVTGPGKPSTEIEVHNLIYRARPDVTAVVHAHCRACMAFAMARKDFGKPCNLEIYSSVGRPVLVPFAPPGEWGPALEPVVQDADCFLLANHGVVALGRSLREAGHRIEEVENFAHALIAARQLGGEVPFNDRELRRIERFLKRVGVPKPRSVLTTGKMGDEFRDRLV